MNTTKIKIPYRHGVISYGSNDPTTFSVRNGVVTNNHTIIFSIAAGENNYYFEIAPNTKLGTADEDGIIIAYIDHTTTGISFLNVRSTLEEIYVDSLPDMAEANSIQYDRSKPRGYVFSPTSGWCPRDFLVIVDIKNSVPIGVPLVSQLGQYGYSNIAFSYKPKIYDNQYVCSIQNSEIFILEDYDSIPANFNLTLFNDGIEIANNIDKYKPVCINSAGAVDKCTANDDYRCIGISTENMTAGGLASFYVSNGTIMSSDWNFSIDDVIYINEIGDLVTSVDFENVKYIKTIGTAISSNKILLDIKRNILINEN